MAISITSRDFGVDGNKRVNTMVFTADTSYPTGGYALSAGTLGLGSVNRVAVDLPVNSTPAIRAARYDYTNSTLMFFGENFAEIAAATDLSAFSGRLEARGF
jgi:hypothetical protein